MANKLLKKIEITGIITLKTGLHIGGTNSSMQIGGIDKGVIRNPISNQPFIPGSSLKGKMRTLFQVSKGIIKTLDKPMGGNVNNVATDDKEDADLFGNASSDKKQKASRLIVRDCEMTNAKEVLEKTEMPYTEGKTEVVIDRITSAASPRQIERVPAGAKFSLNMVLNIWEQDNNEQKLFEYPSGYYRNPKLCKEQDNNEQKLFEYLFQSMELLRDDYLGGSGSRGYGQISIDIEKISEKSSDNYGKKDAVANDLTGIFADQINKLKS